MQAVIKVHTSRQIGKVDPMIFGQYLEHVQPQENCIYGAILDEGSALAGENGLRTDVIAACKDMQVPVTRWPGGCFADVYHWQDGVGPRSDRPVRRNWHWGGLETNCFGTDEFLSWCEQTGSAPYINVNLGSGTLDEALRWLDYCNGTQPTSDVQARQTNGHQQPYNVPLWGLGNEQWGAWEAGHMNAKEYAERLRNWAQFMKRADSSIKLLGVGSHDAADPEWDLTVLQTAGRLLDYLTIHSYAHTLVENRSSAEYYAVVGSALLFEERLQRACSTIAAAMSTTQLKAPIRIALDEWNIRHLVRDEKGGLTLSRQSPRTMSDALFAAGVFHAMMRLAPHIGMACYVFLVNGNAVLLTKPDGLIKTPLYDVFRLYRKHMCGTALRTEVDTPSATYALRAGNEPTLNTMRSIPYIDAMAVCNEEKSTLAVAIINRHESEPIDIRLDADGIENALPGSAWELSDPDVWATNNWTTPNRVRCRELAVTSSVSTLKLKPHSLALLEFDTR